MTAQLRGGFRGLVTASAEATGDAGALVVADNVSLRKRGALSERPSFASSASVTSGVLAFVRYGTGWVAQRAANVITNSANQTVLYAQPDGVTQTNMSPDSVRADLFDATESRGNLYLPSALGVFRMTAATDTALIPAGLDNAPHATATVTAGTGLFALANNTQVVYRMVGVKTVNGLVLRSPPSSPIVVQNTTGGSATVTLTFYWRSVPVVPDKLEVYRGRAFSTSVTPDDELQLVATLPNPSSWFDTVPETKRGATLYTSPSRGGIESANARPPGCALVESFRSCLFFGNLLGPHRVTLSYSETDRTGTVTGYPGYYTVSATATNGSNVLTGIASTTGLRAGLMLTSSTGTFPFSSASPYPSIASVGANSVTLNANANASGTLTFTFRDTVGTGSMTLPLMKGGATSTYARRWSTGNDYVVYETGAAAGYDTTIVIERYDRGGSAFTASSSAQYAWGTLSASQASANDVEPHGIAWSNPDEPEHVPLSQYATVGNASKAIVALAATRDSLFVFKEDGIFRLSGTYPDFRIDPFDMTTICVVPSSVRRAGNAVYFLANRGLCRVTESGVEVLSTPISDEIATLIAQVRGATRSTGLGRIPGFTGAASAGDDASGEYWLALGASNPSFGGHALVYNALADAFSTYSFGATAPTALGVNERGEPCYATSSAILEPTSSPGSMTVTITPAGFSEPGTTQKLWTHLLVGFSRLIYGSSLYIAITSSEPVTEAPVSEIVSLPLTASQIQLERGTLVRHLIPRGHARGWLLRPTLSLVLNTGGRFVLEFVALDARESLPNRLPSHGTSSS